MHKRRKEEKEEIMYIAKGLVFTSEGTFASINQLVICANKEHLIRTLQKKKKTDQLVA